MAVEVIKALGFVDRRGPYRGTRALRGTGGLCKVVAPKMMRFDDWMHRHMKSCYVMLAIGVIGFLR